MTKCPAKLQKAVENFLTNSETIARLSEFDIRETFISTLAKALDWNWENEGLSPTELEVYRESTIEGGRPDLKFCINGLSRFYMETKKVRPEFTVQEIHQAWVYGYSSGHSFSALCNFKMLWIIDCRNTPLLNTSDPNIKFQVVIKLSLLDYVNKWEDIFALLGKESIKKGSLQALEEEIRRKNPKIKGVDLMLFPSISGAKPIDQFFLSQLDSWRIQLANNMHHCNQSLSTEQLTILADRMLNFIVFTRVLESRNLAPKNISLKNTLGEALKKPGTCLKEINSLRDTLDSLFNGTVYKMFPFQMDIDEVILADIVRSTYPPHSPYNLAYLPIRMLGVVYEQFLGHQLSFKGQDIRITQKREIQKAGGIYYTETYVSSFMVHQLLDSRIKDLTPDDILSLRIADIACGSGSFLITILSFLMLWMTEICKRKDIWREKYLEQSPNGLKLNLNTKLEILRNCIYGVDIDSEAVNVTKFSLYLQVLDDETPARIQDFYKRKRKPILPILDRNIKSGNSLVTMDIVNERLFKKDYVKMIKPFDFQEEFPEVFEQGGFDLIFGNPPYGAKISTIEKNYFRRYALAAKNFNTANLFIDRVRRLIKPDGGWCFIVPKSLIYSDRWLSTRNALRNEFTLGVDASKAFKKVKLEQVIVGCDNKIEGFTTGVLTKGEQKTFKGNRKLSFSDILPVNITPKEIELGEIIAKNSVSARNFFRLERGSVPTSILRSTGTVSVYRGKDVQGYVLLDSNDKISTSQAEAFLCAKHDNFREPKIMAQQIVAHILHPFPHIRFIAAYDDEERLSVDTVSNIFLISPETDKNLLLLLLGILNSNICSWFADRFIYGKAIRTMHFDNYQLSHLRFPLKSEWKSKIAKEIIELVEERRKIHVSNTDIDFERFVKYAKVLEIQINKAIGKLFGLSNEHLKEINYVMGTKALVETGELGKNLKIADKSTFIRKSIKKIERRQQRLFEI